MHSALGGCLESTWRRAFRESGGCGISAFRGAIFSSDACLPEI